MEARNYASDFGALLLLTLRNRFPRVPAPRLMETVNVMITLDKTSSANNTKNLVYQILLSELQTEDTIRENFSRIPPPVPADGPPPPISVSPSPNLSPSLSPSQNFVGSLFSMASLPFMQPLSSPPSATTSKVYPVNTPIPPPPLESISTCNFSTTAFSEEISPRRSTSTSSHTATSSPETCPTSPRSPPPGTFLWTMEMQGGDAPPKPRRRARAKNPEAFFCHKCGATETIEWRRGPDNCKSLCNGCGLRFAKMVKKELRTPPNPNSTFAVESLLNPTT
ncbi:hypothetical protein Pelo_14325 [Pelomyxa schiedti]|nr:hypothetical protein Pelo_14325 [Pelomyxa schiedti]